jgi:hypothetical protein
MAEYDQESSDKPMEVAMTAAASVIGYNGRYRYDNYQV